MGYSCLCFALMSLSKDDHMTYVKKFVLCVQMTCISFYLKIILMVIYYLKCITLNPDLIILAGHFLLDKQYNLSGP